MLSQTTTQRPGSHEKRLQIVTGLFEAQDFSDDDEEDVQAEQAAGAQPAWLSIVCISILVVYWCPQDISQSSQTTYAYLIGLQMRCLGRGDDDPRGQCLQVSRDWLSAGIRALPARRKVSLCRIHQENTVCFALMTFALSPFAEIFTMGRGAKVLYLKSEIALFCRTLHE